MKVLNPTVSIVMASHMKPDYIESAINSVLVQTRQDFQLIVIDSGEWIPRHENQLHPLGSKTMKQIHEIYSRHPLVEWYTLGEPPRLIDRACPYAHIWNLAIRRLVRGTYVCFFADDDLYEPDYIEKMAGFLDAKPWEKAVYCSERRIQVFADGTSIDKGVLSADTPRSTFDNHVDMLQMMVHRAVIDRIGDPWFNEDPDDASCRHADGQFMDRVGQIVGEVANIPDILVTHRFTPVSTYN